MLHIGPWITLEKYATYHTVIVGLVGFSQIGSAQQSPIPFPFPSRPKFFFTCFIWRPLVVPYEPACGEKCLTSIEMSAVMSLVDLRAKGVSYGTGGGGKEEGCAASWTRWWYKKTSNEFILKACWSQDMFMVFRIDTRCNVQRFAPTHYHKSVHVSKHIQCSCLMFFK